MNIEYNFRKAEEKDLMDVFHLSNDPLTRQNSLNTNLININDHTDWFKNKIHSNNSCFYMVEDNNNEIIGFVRFDKTPECLISINLSPNARGKGLGSRIIESASLKFLQDNQESKIFAIIKHSNIASLKSFIKAGYKEIDKIIINDNICYKMVYETIT